jgi:hypothetical protein
VANSSKNPKRAAVKEPAAPISRVQRTLAFMAGSIFGLGVIAIFALLIGEAIVKTSLFETSSIWLTVAFLPDIALPLGFLLFIVLLIITAVGRSRAAKGAGK